MWKAIQLEMERRRVSAEIYGAFKLDNATLDNPFAEELYMDAVERHLEEKHGIHK